MPTDTFANLPADKRERFVAAALDAFAAEPYDQASVTRIVAALGIAKGSVYQYFEDKLDLYRWLLDEGGRRKLAWLTRHGDLAPTAGWWERLRAMYVAGLAFTAAEPRWAQVSLRLYEPTREPRLAELRDELLARGHGWLRDELAAARDRGEVRADVDPEVAAHLLAGLLQDGLLRAFCARLGVASPMQLVDRSVPPERVGAAAIAVVDAALALARHGLGAA